MFIVIHIFGCALNMNGDGRSHTKMQWQLRVLQKAGNWYLRISRIVMRDCKLPLLGGCRGNSNGFHLFIKVIIRQRQAKQNGFGSIFQWIFNLRFEKEGPHTTINLFKILFSSFPFQRHELPTIEFHFCHFSPAERCLIANDWCSANGNGFLCFGLFAMSCANYDWLRIYFIYFCATRNAVRPTVKMKKVFL